MHDITPDHSGNTASTPDGLAVVSHYNSTDQALRISKCGNPACN